MSRSHVLRVILSIVCPAGLLLALLVLFGGAALANSDQSPPGPTSLPVPTATIDLQLRPEGAQTAANRASSLLPSELVTGHPIAPQDDPLAPDSGAKAPDTLVRPWQQHPVAGLAGGAQVAGLGATQAITVVANAHWVYGYTTANAALDLIATQGATTVGLSRTRSDNTGYFSIDTMNAQGRYLDLLPGMTLTVKAAGITVATIPIPGPTTGAVDPFANTVTGQIAGVPLPAKVLISAAGVSLDVTTDAAGAFTANFNGVADLLWWDGATVAYWQSPNWLAWTFYPRGGIVAAPQYDEVDGCTEPGQQVIVTVNHVGATTTRTATGAAGSGCWYVTFPALDPGDTVTANFGTSTVTQIVSNLGGTADPAADRVAVTGPASSPVTVRYMQYDGLSTGYLWRFGTTDATGAFTAQFQAGAINRYSWPVITHADGAHSDTYQAVPIPWVVAYWNANTVFGYTTPGTPVTATLMSDGLPFETAHGQANAQFGYFSLTFNAPFVATWNNVRVQTAAFDVTVGLAPITLDFERDTDNVVWTSWSNSRILAFIRGTDFGRIWRGWLVGGSAETVSIPLGDQIDLHNGTYGYLYRPQAGDPDDLGWNLKYGYAPRLVVNERYNAFFGNLTRPNTDFTVTAKRGGVTTGNGNGKTNAWHSVSWTYFQDAGGQEIDLWPGDSVEVSWDSEHESMEVLGLTGQVDGNTDRVTGTWLPNSFVRVREQNTYTGLFVPTDATGAFVADFTGLYDLQGGMRVDISAWTADWNRTEIIVQVPFVRANVTWDNVDGEFAPGEVVSYTVRDAGGAVKATRSGETPADGWFSLDCNCDMVPGDTVHVTSDRGFDATLTLIPITVHIDAANDRISGVMSGATLPGTGHVWAWSAARDTGQGMDVIIAADGSYTADLSGKFDLQPGDEGDAYYYDANRNQVGVGWRTGKMDVFYAGDWVWVDGPPGAPVTVTVQSKAVMHGTINSRGYLEGWNDNLVTWTPARPDIAPGDVVILEVAGYTKRVDPVLTINITKMDTAADQVAGTISGPGHDQIAQVYCEGYNPDTGWLRADYDIEYGTYACDFGAAGWDLERATDMSVRYRDADGDMVVNERQAQWARANITWDSVGGIYGLGVTMQFTVTTSSGAYKASGSAVGKSDGWVNDVWVDADLIPGDRVHVTTNDGFDAWLTLVDIQGRIEPATNKITGQVSGAPLPASGLVVLHNPFADSWNGQGFDIAADGSFTADLNPYDIVVGDDSEVWYVDANGNRPGAWLATLSTETNYGGEWVVLNTAPNVPFTVTVAGSTGQFKAQLAGMTDDGGSVRGWQEQWQDQWTPSRPDIQPGDRVTFQANGYTKVVQPVAEIRAVANVGNDRITGRIFAPGVTETVPTWCSVWVDNGPPSVNAQPYRVDPNGGVFTCDFRSVGWDLRPGQYAAVGFLNPNSDTTYNSFTVESSKTYLPVILR